ncbi:glycoside hydrolase TIM-barrel-like domain-containing protein [Orientia tsutsugamushi]|uniref:glycoside hydrolase/phage tail family protein n=1 Tax=Orientia tsutsugamushi TaxID=784 RepID=UPI001239FF8E|nr:glycoside hydrolase TIM-barrel-like domain-containing protein [Orientia tsutsugamushi]QES96367.1 hypothetical protein F0363_07130 [Orientia tsutsugamushi]
MLIKSLGSLGGYIGKSLGGGMLSTIGRFTGRTIGNYLEFEKVHQNHEEHNKKVFEYYHTGKQIHSLQTVPEAYGDYIPLIFGTVKLHGTIIWIGNFNIKKEATSITKQSSTHNYEHNINYVSIGFALCEGPITKIGKIWHNNQVINDLDYEYTLYYGTETQEPDPLITAAQNNSNCTPAFRGLAYIVFKNINLNDFNNKIPIFSFEVTRNPNITLDCHTTLQNANSYNTADMIQSIVIIPGSGEFTLDPQIQYKYNSNSKSTSVAVNCHNNFNLANSVVSLNQLLNTCNNIKWTAPVVCWFGTNLDANKCKIIPKVEYHNYGPNWQVADYIRDNAQLVSRDLTGNLKYGGSIDDQSLLRYLALLKNKKLKIMLYPIIMMDTNGKPWRGNIHVPQYSASALNLDNIIATFFRGGKEYTAINPKKGSYNYFILHYAKLVAGKVDAFIIGSELKKLTSTYNRFSNNAVEKFPAVSELIELAKAVKSILGKQVLVSYAADWSEYHHIDTNDGYYYHLDPLWACDTIDFVGIDAYFPLTHTQDSNITIEEIKHGWESGEGYDYYFDNNQLKQFNNIDLAWKNIKHWWSKYHTNSDGKQTMWIPKMKPIWFTEFGVPSVDKATNQPNIFFAPDSKDQQYPKYSTGAVDFLIQSKAIKASLEYWQQYSNMIENIFLWAWDARPYPTWPTNPYWKDRELWPTGHWINGKLTSINLAAMILELCTKSGIDSSKVDVTSIDDEVAGLLITKNHKTIDVINMLRCCYFFDIKTSAINKISFMKRNHKTNLQLSARQCIIESNQASVNHTIIAKNQILNNINLKFIDSNNSYCLASFNYTLEQENYSQQYNLNLPIVTSLQNVQNICQTILKNANAENILFSFILPISYAYLEVSDIITLIIEDMKFIIRITNIKYSQLIIIIGAVTSNIVSTAAKTSK